VGVLAAIVSGGLIRVIVPRLGQVRGVYVGLALYCLGFLLFAFAGNAWMLFFAMVPYALGSIAGPSLQGLISTQVPPNVQGEVQGGLSSLQSAVAIFAPPFMTSIFSYFTSGNAPFYFPGAAMLTGAFLAFASALWAFIVLRKTH
jgi:DHA1 family tetracycline resistance protein-like MFS transporter